MVAPSLAASTLFAFAASLVVVDAAGFEKRQLHSHSSRASTLPSYIANSLGPYSPYAAQRTYPSPPVGCTIDQVNILQRHGARYPTASAGKRIAASVTKLKSATSFGSSVAFAQNYTYSLGGDDLIPFGATQSYDAGVLTASRYNSLAQDTSNPPFTRTDSKQRCVDSAGNWTAGFVAGSTVVAPSPFTPLVISNAAGSNDTLDDNNCDNAVAPDDFENTWLNIFTPNITARLNAAAPGANLTGTDVLNLAELCGFDTEYFRSLSPFCGLFKQSEWAEFEYYFDLDKYYGNGYGNALGAIQGVGYVNELFSRLTNDLSYANNDQTQVNHTLDASSSTFPLGRPIYADFTHDDQITSILGAMGLKNGPTLPVTGPPVNQVWVTSQIVPFSGRLVTERLQCTGTFDGTYVRFLINDQLQAAEFCGGDKTGGARVCTMDDFIASQSYSTNNGYGEYAQGHVCSWPGTVQASDSRQSAPTPSSSGSRKFGGWQLTITSSFAVPDRLTLRSPLAAQRYTVSAATASFISTLSGFPLDSVKSRLQVKRYSSVLDCVQKTYHAEGMKGFFRGVTIPLLTITVVRTSSFSIYTGVKRLLKENQILTKDTVPSVGALGFCGGASSGILLSLGTCAFEYTKISQQLEYLLAVKRGEPFEPKGTIKGFLEGTGLYFGFYDASQAYIRKREGPPLVPHIVSTFMCGCSAGIGSWAMIYPIDLVKTKVQR
ncbi:acid phosphatase, phytase [Pseudohyphozyma bogoriensis]|nr:acid phosphatase, phytase [Pseudohyphozyma bogoriensis]